MKSIAALLFALTTIGALAQQSVRFGIKTGVQSADVRVPGFIEDASFLPDFRPLATWQAGGVAQWVLHPHFSLQGELLYTQKGFQLNEDFDLTLFQVPVPTGVTAISRFHYVEMPLLAKVSIGQGPAKAYVIAGPTFGYALSGDLRTRARFLVELDLTRSSIDLDAVNYQRFEVGGLAGVGLSVDTGLGQFFVDARFQHGFSQPYDIPVVRERVQHFNYGLSAGFAFNL